MHFTARLTTSVSIPSFTPSVVAAQLRDGYWLEAPDINGDGKPDLFGHGLKLGGIYWYQNPDRRRRLVVDGLSMPVGADYADVARNGRSDIIVCYDLYDKKGTIVDANDQGGKIDWIENPGDAAESDARWKRHYVGRATGMHRLRAGYFTQTERLEIIGFPIVTKGNVHGVLPIVLFTQPDNVLKATEWPMTVIDHVSFRVLHGAEKRKGLIPGSDLESILIASDEGVIWLYFDASAAKWCRVLIGTGELTQFEQTGFKGSGDLDVGSVGGDPFAFVAALEPFHGNTVAVYVKGEERLSQRGPMDALSSGCLWRSE